MMSLVVLHYFLSPQVEHADRLVVGTRQHALISRMEIRAGNRALKKIKSLHLLFLLHVPNYQLLIFSSRTDQSHVSAHLGTVNPVIMTQKRSFKFLSIDIPHLDALIITGRQKSLPVSEETH